MRTHRLANCLLLLVTLTTQKGVPLSHARKPRPVKPRYHAAASETEVRGASDPHGTVMVRSERQAAELF